MKYIIDTHILVWYITQSKKLKKNILNVLNNPRNEFIIHIIVLAEIKYLIQKKRVKLNYKKLLNIIGKMDNVIIYNIDLNVIDKIPLSLDIHDGLIVGTGLVFKEIFHENVNILSVDEEIINYNGIKTIP